MRTIVIPLLAAAVAGCGGSADGSGSFDAASGGTARAYERTESGVTVSPDLLNPGRFTASRTVTVSNDDAGASRAVVALGSVSGTLDSAPATSAGYRIQAVLSATAGSEADARAALDTLTVEHRDGAGAGVLYLAHRVRWGDYGGNAQRSARVSAGLPSALDYRLYQEAVSAIESSTGLHGQSAELRSTSGGATLAGTWDAAVLGAVSGTLSVSGDIAGLRASTTSGTLTATLACVRDTQARLESTSGAVDVTVSQAGAAGFDLVADTVSGAATIAVAGTSPQGEQSMHHAHYRSAGFATADPQVAISGETVSGGVTIHD